MDLMRRLLQEEDGQGLVEYTMVIMLVAMVFWFAVRDTGIAGLLTDGWSKVTDCVTAPFSCTP